MDKTKNVIILAAGDISGKLGFLKAYYQSPALVPVNTKPLIVFLLDFYSKYAFPVYLVVNSGDKAYIEENIYLKDFNFHFIEISSTESVNETLAYALSKMPFAPQTVVNLVTTIPVDFPENNTVLLENSLSYNLEWSCVEIDGEACTFLFKHARDKQKGAAFTGIFSFETSMLEKAVGAVADKDDLMEVVRYFHDQQELTGHRFKFTEWIDAGHELNYSRAKLQLINSRSFNSMSVSYPGVLLKRSTNFSKLKDEAGFMSALPQRLAILFPRIISPYALDQNSGTGSYEMEFYGYPSLAELQLFWKVKEEVWSRIFNDIQSTLSLFREHRCVINKPDYLAFYTGKIEERQAQFAASLTPEHQGLLDDYMVINGKAYVGFNLFKDRLFERIGELYAADDFSITHGDLCFNNMLYDIPHRLLKLIDPRGSFGSNHRGIYGDIKYDLAKLAHSAIGGYDYLVNNLFDFNSKGNHVQYNIYYRDNQAIIYENAAQLIRMQGFDIKDIMLIAGTLFLTMPPLHADSEIRQQVMYTHGIRLINENL